MEIEEIGVGTRLGMRGLKNKGIMEISEDPETGDFFSLSVRASRGNGGSLTFPRGCGG